MLNFLSDLAPWGAAAAAVLVAWLADKRARQAHREKQAVDHAELINKAYQAILDELRSELQRRERVHEQERREWLEIERQMRERITRLEEKVEALEAELSAVEKRQGFHNDD